MKTEGGSASDALADIEPAELVQRARSFAEPLLDGRVLPSGESAAAHAAAVADILRSLGAAFELQAAGWLVNAADLLQRPDEVLAKAFGAPIATLVGAARRLRQVQRQVSRPAQRGKPSAVTGGQQAERVRRMLLAFSADLRVVLLRLASTLQTLRDVAATKRPCPDGLAQEAMQVDAPLANRLGIWQLKWEIEDLAFRFLDPDGYKAVAALVDARRIAREQEIEQVRVQLAAALADVAAPMEVLARPKHLYSIARKMRNKATGFDRVFDVRGVRVIVPAVADCYAALDRVHRLYRPLGDEYHDYIARPKVNGYQSLHTVVLDAAGRPIEVQIRTAAMHSHAEHGVAAHWAYKEAGLRGHAGVLADGRFDAQVAAARKAVLLQLLAWGKESSDAADAEDAPQVGPPAALFDQHVYVFTPQAEVVELPAGATPIDFAYAVHTSLGHRCRGAKLDGVLVPLVTPLRTGQTVEITAARDGGPSFDWLNAELGYLKSPRSRAKVRSWFNVKAAAETAARGRAAVERVLQRLGKTALKLDDLAAQLGFDRAEALFEVVGKDEYSLRHIEQLLRPTEPPPATELELAPARRNAARAGSADGGVLVVGIGSLLTGLARCCRPAPPDAIVGYVTRGKGVAVHRHGCPNLATLRARAPERVIAVAWGDAPVGPRPAAAFPVDVTVEAVDRPGLLRDISDVFAQSGMNLTGVHTRSLRDSRGTTAWMTMTVTVADTSALAAVLGRVANVAGVRTARRR